jgi:hypothetical protein
LRKAAKTRSHLMQESIFQLEREWFFVRHTGFAENKPVIFLFTGWVSPALFQRIGR